MERDAYEKLGCVGLFVLVGGIMSVEKQRKKKRKKQKKKEDTQE